MNPEQRIEDLGHTLPEAAAPAAAYVPWVSLPTEGTTVFTSGQLPISNGELMTGRCGEDVTLETAQQAATACALNAIAQLRVAAGELSNITRILKLTVFVSSSAAFTDQHLVANGASQLMVDVFGEEVGSHARSAVGVAALPLGAPVEVEVIAQIK